MQSIIHERSLKKIATGTAQW